MVYIVKGEIVLMDVTHTDVLWLRLTQFSTQKTIRDIHRLEMINSPTWLLKFDREKTSSLIGYIFFKEKYIWT